MDVSEKNGQPSLEEILASIRRSSFADNAAVAFPEGIDLGAIGGAVLAGAVLADDHQEFDLPSIFRSPAPSAPEKHTPLLGRLTDAFRGTANGEHKESRGEAASSPEFVDHGPLAVETELAVVQPDALSTLKTARYETSQAGEGHGSGTAAHQAAPDAGTPAQAAAETASDTQSIFQKATSGWSSAPTASASGNDGVKRVMTPFKDTRFSAMTQPQSAPEPVPQAPASTPVFTPPAAQQPGKVDFSSIIPARLEALRGAPAEPLRREEPPPPVPAEPAAAAAPQPSAFASIVEIGQPGLTFAPLNPLPQPLPELPPASAESVPAPAEVFGIRQPEPHPFTAPPRAPQRAQPQAPQADSAQGGVEDATADLLRPMLKQWLAENMPRMVEKALHIEVAESLKSGKKPGTPE